MDEALFHIDQEVTPIEEEFQIWVQAHSLAPMPKLNEIYHVAAYGTHDDYPGKLFIRLAELSENDWYLQNLFAPVMPDEAFQEAIMEILPEEVGSPV